MKRAFQLRRTTVLMAALVALMIGLACGHRWTDFTWIWVLVSSLVLLSTIWRRKWSLLFAAVLFGLCLGWWRGATFRKQILPYEKLYGRQVSVRVTARTDGTYAESGNLGFDAGNIIFTSPMRQKLPGSLKIEVRGLSAVFRGDELEVSGKLYPAGGSRQGSLKFAPATLISHHLNWLEKTRMKFVAGMQTALPEPLASFGLGLLIGQRSTLPKEVTTQLSIVGLTHIIAVSGYNLTIIVSFLGKRLGRSKYQTLVLSLVLITLFVLVTGFSASIVRAAIVSILSLGAWYYGRTFRPLLILLLSGAVTAGWNPTYIWSDIGWYLSFLAFFGVLIVAPLVTKYFWKTREPGGIMALLIESASAQIMAAPIIIYIFGEASLIALPSNLLVVPLVPLAMLFSLIAGLAGMSVSAIAGWLAWPARIILTYMLEMIDLLSRVPHALMNWKLPLPYILLFYGLICLTCTGLWIKTRPTYDKIADEDTILKEAEV